MAYPPQFLDEIRSRVSLASVVSRHVKLTRRGREYVGLCPFHNEKTPSFNVVEDKAFYHCFGCGAHGDVIGFSMRVGGAGFREAVEALAKEAGLQVPDELPEDRERAVRAKTLHDVCEAACAFFAAQLKEPNAQRARDYLARRGLDQATIARFRLGWAPSTRDALKRALGHEFETALLVEAGLLRRPENGDTFDFFRGRVIFPISDRQGRVIAFGGRLIEDGEPKYLNSPDTPIFEKGRTLYALHLARTAPRSDLVPIVAEGYMDVIALHRAGFTGAVAPLGTALTETQLVELWRLGDRPILCFDGDKAGRNAAVRALDRALPLLQPDNSLRFALLPEGEDPDSLVKSHGTEALKTHLEDAMQTSEFIWRIATEERDSSFFDTPEKILRLQTRVYRRIRAIADGQVQREFQHHLMDRIWRLRRGVRNARTLKETDALPPALRATRAAGWAETTRVRRQETLLVVIALNHPELARDNIDSFAALRVRDREMNELWQHVIDRISSEEGLTGSDLLTRLDVRLRSIADRLNSSILDRNHYAHLAGNREFAGHVWRAARAKYELPEIEREHLAAVKTWAENGSEENLATVIGYKNEIARLREQSVTAELMAG
ncbi:MAG TPA: DNA primase [Stellaceae bacterium]|nr:DNA primase [Stellaceae bacterium]